MAKEAVQMSLVKCGCGQERARDDYANVISYQSGPEDKTGRSKIKALFAYVKPLALSTLSKKKKSGRTRSQ